MAILHLKNLMKKVLVLLYQASRQIICALKRQPSEFLQIKK